MHTYRKSLAVGLAFVFLAGQVGCASILPGDPETPGQKFYSAYGTYNAVLEVAVAWMESPTGQSRPEALADMSKVIQDVGAAIDAAEAVFCIPPEPGAPVPAECPNVSTVDREAAFRTYTRLLLNSIALLQSILAREGVTS